MDIFNDWTREVVCVRNRDNGCFPCRDNAKFLTVGKKYTVTDIDVHSWYSLVRLKEFPGFQFNSVLFDEIDEATDEETEEDFDVGHENVTLNIRDNLLITAGARAAYMDSSGSIDIPEGLDGEDRLTKCIVKAVDVYMSAQIDTPFDLYIESLLLYEFRRENDE